MSIFLYLDISIIKYQRQNINMGKAHRRSLKAMIKRNKVRLAKFTPRIPEMGVNLARSIERERRFLEAKASLVENTFAIEPFEQSVPRTRDDLAKAKYREQRNERSIPSLMSIHIDTNNITNTYNNDEFTQTSSNHDEQEKNNRYNNILPKCTYDPEMIQYIQPKMRPDPIRIKERFEKNHERKMERRQFRVMRKYYTSREIVEKLPQPAEPRTRKMKIAIPNKIEETKPKTRKPRKKRANMTKVQTNRIRKQYKPRTKPKYNSTNNNKIQSSTTTTPTITVSNTPIPQQTQSGYTHIRISPPPTLETRKYTQRKPRISAERKNTQQSPEHNKNTPNRQLHTTTQYRNNSSITITRRVILKSPTPTENNIQTSKQNNEKKQLEEEQHQIEHTKLNAEVDDEEEDDPDCLRLFIVEDIN